MLIFDKEKLEKHRKRTGKTQEEMAKYLGITPSVYHYMAVKGRPPQLKMINRIATALGVKAKTLLKETA